MAIPTLPTVPNDPYAGAPLAESALAQQAITPGAPLLPQYQDVYLNRNQPAPEPAVVEPVEGEDPYAGATVVEPEADPYAGAAPVTAVYGYDMEKLSATPVEVLKKDKTEFNPVDFYAKNTDALLRDPEALKKVEAVFEERDKERMTPFGLVKAAVTAPLNAVLHPIETAKKTVGVAKAGAEFVGTLLSGAKQVVATGAEVAGNLAEGDLPGAAKGISEAIAAADLAQQRWVTIVTDKVGPSFGVIPRGKTARERLAFDADFKRAELKAAEGNGQLASDLGASQDELRSLGVNLDPGAIERLSVIEDPLFLVPVGSAIGVTGRAGKFLLGKATSPATAEAFAKGINSAMERAAAWPIAKTGAAVEKAGALAEKAPKLLKGGVAQGATGGMIASAMHGNFIPLATALAAPTALKYGGKAVAAVGRGVQAAAPAVGRVAAETAKGAGEGAVLSMPLFLGSNEEEREGLLGMIAGSGFLRGGLAATGVAKGLAERGERLAGRSVQNKLAAKIFEAVDQGPVKDSKAYGTDTALDAAHQQHSATLSRGEQSLLSTAREFFRDAGVEIYGLDKNTFVANVPNVAGASAAEGFFLSRGERLNPDGTRSPVLQVLLNKDTNGLGHELYHAFKSLDPQGATALEAHITKTWTPEEQAWLSDSYNSAINGGKPKSQWTVHLNEKQILEEAAAEVFGRVVNATDLSGVRPSIVKRASTFASTLLEKMGYPLAGKALPQGPGVSALGVRPGTAEVKVSQDFLTDITRRVKEGSLGAPTPGAPLEVGAGPAAISRRPSAPQPSAPPKAAEAPATPKPATPAPLPEAAAEVPVPAAPAAPTAENIRVTPKEQADFAAERSKVTNADQALAAAVKSGDPAQVTHVTAINDSMANGHAVEVVHKGVIREGGPTPEAPVARGTRRAEQAEAYVAEAMGAVPESVRELHQKLFFGTRWLKAGKQLTARSLDKALANVKNAADMSAGKVTLPYEVDAAGKLTEAGWAEVVQDLKDYWSNQDRGFRGDGKALTPETRTRDVGQSIPPEDPRGPAALISTERTDFLNLVQGLNIPETVRGQKKGVIPGNVKGQLLAEAQGKKPAKPAGFTPEDVQRTTFKPIEGVGVRSIAEVNPLRNDLRAKGAPVEKLIEVTENINVKNIESVTPRPDVTGRGGSTDITRAGFSAKLAERFPVKEPQSSFSPAADFEKSLDPVKMAAIRTKGGQIFTGSFHGEAYLNLADAVGRGEFKEKLPEGFKSLTDLLDSVMGGEKFDFIEDGFVTESGKYLNRKEAFEHGKKIGQLKAGYGEATRKGQFEKEGVLESDEFNRGKSFSPSTEKGKEFAKQGYEFTFDVDELGGRLVHVNKDGQRVGLVESVPEGDKKAEVSMTFVTPEERGKGLAEAMYRELLTKLKADGIELVSGLAVSPEPIAIRKKIFGGFESLATKKSGESVGPVSVEEALAGLTKLRKGERAPFPAVDVVNRITDESKFSPAPSKEVRDIAERAAKASGNESYKPSARILNIKEDVSKKLADFYEAAKSSPNDPAVKASYQALIDQTEKQGQEILDAGYTIEPFTGEGEPYKNSAEMLADVRDNKHMFFLPTEGAFGEGAKPTDNPMLQPSKIAPGQVANDVFRWVHDFFGHAKEGFQFGPKGELNAWKAHSEMFTPEAQGALAAETLAQNSWVNYGKHLRDSEGKVAAKGAKGFVPPTERPFAEQKNIVVPDELIAEARGEEPGKYIQLNDPGFLGMGSNVFGPIKPERLDDALAAFKKGAANRGRYLAKFSVLDEVPEGEKLFSPADYFDESPSGREEAGTFSVRRKEPKRDKQGRPLTEEGLVDYERLYKEKVAAEKAAEAKDIKSLEKKVAKGKYKMPAAKSGGKLTGFILPNKEFVPLNTAFHENFLAENASALNEQFGTRLSGKSDPNERFDALNAGFVRIRSTPDGALRIEASADKFAGSKKTILNKLADEADSIDRLFMTLVDESGNEVDTVTARVVDLEGPDRYAALADAVESLRPKGAGRFSPALAPREDSPKFKSWFQSSKVVDESGSPKVLYHGTKNPVAEFKAKRTGAGSTMFGNYEVERYGVFASEDPSVATEFALQGGETKGASTMPLYMRIESPLDMTSRGYSDALFNSVEAAGDKLGLNGYYMARRLGELWDSKVWNLFDADELNNPQDWINLFKELDYDGIKFHEPNTEVKNNLSWVAFEPEQVKSASGNVGEFSANPDIRFSAKLPTDKEVSDALFVNKRPYVGAHRDLKPGTPVGLRIDIPAFTQHGVYVITVHEKASGGSVGKRIGHDSVATVDNPTFFSKESGAIKIKEGAPKFPIATVEGEFNPAREVPKAGGEWTEVGFNPVKHSYFYEKGTEKPVVGGEQAVSAGNSVFVKNAEFGDRKDFAFSVKTDETVVAAAWKDSQGEVHTGPFHAAIYEDLDMSPLAGQDDFNIAAGEGFVTNAGRFVDREEAAKLGKASGQLSKEVGAEVAAEDFNNFGEGVFSAAPKKVERETGKGGQKFFPQGTPEFNAYAENKIAKSKEFPEAFPLEFRKDENGNYLAQWDGDVLPAAKPYNLLKSDLAEKSGSKEKFLDALGTKLVKEYREAKKNPEIAVGEHWYSIFREKVGKVLGDDTKLFAELLGATSPQQAVGPNFKDALAAYNQFKRGAYDAMIEKYREGKKKFFDGDLAEFTEATGKKGKKADYAAFMSWWQNKHNLLPTKADGKKFGMNSRAVMKVLDRSWLEGVQGPKTPNFTGNLSGTTFKATIDVWAMRALSRLAGEDSGKPWRVQAANESGVSDPDFYFGQDAFQKAADEIGIKADALQAILWFAEKDRWEKNGWTGAAGKAKSDYNTLLDRTTKTPEGFLDLAPDEVKPKKGARKVAGQLELSDIEPVSKSSFSVKQKPEVRIERIDDEPGISGHRVVAADGTGVYKTLPFFSYAEAKRYAENTGRKVVKK